LNRSTENSLVDTLSGSDFRLRAQQTYEFYTKKWEYRRQGKILNYSDVPGSVRRALSPKKANMCKHLPVEFVQYLNATKSFCPICKTRNTIAHLKIQHNCQLPDALTLLGITRRVREAKVPRKESVEMARNIIKPFLEKAQSCIGSQLKLTLLS